MSENVDSGKSIGPQGEGLARRLVPIIDIVGNYEDASVTASLEELGDFNMLIVRRVLESYFKPIQPCIQRAGASIKLDGLRYRTN